ncbi:pentapeptide repeat-containing protein [Neomegalonema perideroedes]|uniref:pentapeptide repeat-containing protein n=1 Tax=Neomegalonema perideroedes TaxID=217219 RepID=UPI0012FDF506|nr:pentapeptide repeat-containing protein [Neomegalonema perideroedes]
MPSPLLLLDRSIPVRITRQSAGRQSEEDDDALLNASDGELESRRARLRRARLRRARLRSARLRSARLRSAVRLSRACDGREEDRAENRQSDQELQSGIRAEDPTPRFLHNLQHLRRSNRLRKHMNVSS